MESTNISASCYNEIVAQIKNIEQRFVQKQNDVLVILQDTKKIVQQRDEEIKDLKDGLKLLSKGARRIQKNY